MEQNQQQQQLRSSSSRGHRPRKPLPNSHEEAVEKLAYWREQAEIHLQKREEQDQLFKEACAKMAHWEEQEALRPDAAVSTHLLSTGSEDPDRR
ncbi:hypothetical protein FAVG1_02590 [Fusarium avenaceum]|nr:hypothetical protein FAVG1_02590 [Fusarium avenaceum]